MMDFALGFLTAEATAASQPESAGEIMSGAGMTILTGLVVVFSVLILLTFIFYLFGKVAGRGQKAAGKSAGPAPAPQKVAASAPAPRAAAPAPVIEDGISDEVVAVIAAAVASMSEGGRKYSLRSVSRVRGQRPVWAAAGLAENTRPF